MIKNKPKEDQKDQRRGGFYWLGKEPYASVTHILKVIDKPALRYWFGKQVYLAMVKDPTLDEGQALSSPYQKSEKAKGRGKTIHSIVEAYKKSGIVIKDIPKQFRPYAQAFYKWVKDNNVNILQQEKTVVSKKHRYAGTLDLIAKINSEDNLWLIDIKTGKDIYPEVYLQLSAYKEAFKEQGNKVDRIAVLLLKDNGDYKFEVGQSIINVFLAAKKLWEWFNRDICKEVGYFTEGGKNG